MRPEIQNPAAVPSDGLVGAVRRASWGAIFAGVVVALAIQVALSLLGLAIGFGALDPARDEQLFRGAATGTAIWLLVTGLIAVFTGGWVAGRLAGQPREVDGTLHGVTTWAVVTLVSLWLLTTAVGSVVGGAVTLIGQGLGLAGQGIAAVAPENVSLSLDAETRETLRTEAREILQQTDKPALQPEALEARGEEVGEQLQARGEQALQEPGQVDQHLDQAIDILFAQGADVVDAADREAAVNVLVARTDMERAEAEQVVQRWESTLTQAGADIEQAGEEIGQQAVATSQQATKALSQAAAWSFVGMLLGAAAAGIGGALGSPKDLYVAPPEPRGRRIDEEVTV